MLMERVKLGARISRKFIRSLLQTLALFRNSRDIYRVIRENFNLKHKKKMKAQKKSKNRIQS